jgi:hypothetical protein
LCLVMLLMLLLLLLLLPEQPVRLQGNVSCMHV